VGFEPTRSLETRKLLIPCTERTDKNGRNAEARYTAGTRSLAALLMLGLLTFILASVTSAQTHRTFRVPFHTVSGMILVDAIVNGHPASLLLDTGANNTILSPQAVGLATVQLRALQATGSGTGAESDYVARKVALQLGERHWMNRRVLVMDLDDASKRLGTRIDGFLGQDVLRTFPPCGSTTALTHSNSNSSPPPVVESPHRGSYGGVECHLRTSRRLRRPLLNTSLLPSSVHGYIL
jgi:hypothetical protein